MGEKIQERLRRKKHRVCGRDPLVGSIDKTYVDTDCQEAADHIDTLEARVAERDAELLRIRQAEHEAAHSLDKLRQGLGLQLLDGESSADTADRVGERVAELEGQLLRAADKVDRIDDGWERSNDKVAALAARNRDLEAAVDRLRKERGELISLAVEAEQVSWMEPYDDGPDGGMGGGCWIHSHTGDPLGDDEPWGRAVEGLEAEAAAREAMGGGG